MFSNKTLNWPALQKAPSQMPPGVRDEQISTFLSVELTEGLVEHGHARLVIQQARTSTESQVSQTLTQRGVERLQKPHGQAPPIISPQRMPTSQQPTPSQLQAPRNKYTRVLLGVPRIRMHHSRRAPANEAVARVVHTALSPPAESWKPLLT